MARTLRTRCPVCAAPTYVTEGVRRSWCASCEQAVVHPDSRGLAFVELCCAACGAAMERQLWPGARRCPRCGRGHSPARTAPPPRYLIRERVGRGAAGALLARQRFGDLGRLRLLFAPVWVYRAAQLAWLIGNERSDDRHEGIRRRSRKRDAPSPTLGAPRGGALAYSKHDFGRAPRELIVDPVTERLGWTPYAQHMDTTVLAPLESVELSEVARVLEPELDPDVVLERMRHAVATDALIDERAFYRFFEHRALIGELLVLVYHPYWVASDDDSPVVIDAVDGQPLAPPEPDRIEIPEEPGVASGEGAATPLSCVSCGEDPGVVAEGATLLLCASCGQAQALTPDGGRAQPARFVALPDEAEADDDSITYLPVWRFPVEVEIEAEGGEPIRDRARWKRALRLGEPEAGDEGRPVYLYALAAAPAAAPRFDALSLALSRVQPQLELDEGSAAGRRALSGRIGSEAARGLALALYVAQVKDLSLKAIDRLKQTRVVPGEAELVYLPCVASAGELTDLVVGVTLQSAPLE